MKLATIINSQESLSKLLNTKLPIKIAYKISKLVAKMQPELKIYDEQRIALVKELGTEDIEKKNWQIKPENLAKFTEEITKLTDIDVDLYFSVDKPMEKIKIDDLGDISLEAQDLLSLEWLFE